MGEYITPPSLPPDTYCRRLLIPNTPEWIGTVTGALMSLIYESEWKQTTGITPEDAANRAREMFNQYLVSGDDGECGDMNQTCCVDPLVIKRINPTTGQVEQSSDGGSTWTPAAGGWPSVIVQPVPPVGNGVAATKCDAATNVGGQVQVWIDHVINDFDTATTLLEFGLALVAAIAAAVLAVLTDGLTIPLIAPTMAALGAALAAVWALGKTAFQDYWTTENKDDVTCAAFCCIGDDGSFTDSQFSCFWNKCNEDLPPSPAKMLFMGFLSSVGAAGLNAMAASGMSADSDCEDCLCGGECSPDGWHLGALSGGVYAAPPTVLSSGVDFWELQSVDRGDGQQYVYITSNADDQCCDLVVDVLTGDPTLPVGITCGTSRDAANFVALGLTPPNNLNAYGLGSSTVFTCKITFS